MERVAPSSFVLKVNISCHGCERDIDKVMQKIPGLWPKSTIIDAKQGRVTVSGFVDPQTVIRELRKAGKIAELLVEHNPRAPAAANDRNLQIISRSEVDVGNTRGQAVVVDPVRLAANMAQFVNGIERLKSVELTRDRIKMSFFDYPSGKYGDTSRGSGGTSRSSGGNTTSIRNSISSGGGGSGTTSIRSGGGGGTTSIRTSISSGGGGAARIHSSGSGGTTSIRSGGSGTNIHSGGGGAARIHSSGGGGTTSMRSGGGHRIKSTGARQP
ncbi:unnamed protein product [Ilex paraguariensis]|uniref:HMA domain-containing protein n=1 Tax=Ilex paraguariensis TaxID=185542 RepID=A0ABC8SJD0_9AQUA